MRDSHGPRKVTGFWRKETQMRPEAPRWEGLQPLEPRTLLSSVIDAAPDGAHGRAAQVAFTADDGTQTNRWILSVDGVAQGAGNEWVAADLSGFDAAARFGVRVTQQLDQQGVFTLDVPADIGETRLRRFVSRLPGFEYLEPDTQITVGATIPNDSGFGLEWGLNNTGQSGGKFDADIDAPEAWDLTTGNGNVVVAVIDTGVDWSHPDLAANIWTNPGEIAGNFLDDDFNGYVDDVRGWDFANNDNNPTDDHGHGTHVAGTIAAVGGNGAGVIGVAPGVKILPLKFMSSTGSGATSNAVRALNYIKTLKQRGINVLVSNNSWGGGGYSQSLYDAIAAQRDNGILFVAAAGNDGTNNDSAAFYPANYNLANVISVASTDRYDNKSSFSNYGRSTVDLGAPGSSIYSTTRGGGYGTMSGTSMATPHVAGAAALAWSYKPSATYTQIRGALLNGGDSISALATSTVTGKRLNVRGALAQLGAPAGQAPTITSLTLTPVSVTVGTPFTLTANGVADADGFVTRVEFFRDSNANGSLDATDALVGTDASSAGGWSVSASTGGLSAGSHRFFARATDSSGLVSAAPAAVGTITSLSGGSDGEYYVEDRSAGYSETGAWYTGSLSGGYQGDYRYALSDPLLASASATWTLSGLPAGTYDLFTTWRSASTRASNAPYEIFDGPASKGTVLVNQRVAPATQTVGGIPWGKLGTFTLESGTLTVRLTNKADGSFVMADAIRVVPVAAAGEVPPTPAPTPVAPTIGGLSANPATVQIGQSVTLTATGVADSDASVTKVEFFRDADGNGQLSAADTPLGTDTNGSDGWSSLVSTANLAAGTYTYFARATDSQGLLSAAVSASGQVVAPPPPSGVGEWFVDNGDPGYVETGTWITGSKGGGYLGDYRAAVRDASGSSTASWSLPDIGPGKYEVFTTWNVSSGRSSNAPYFLHDGATHVSTTLVNQTVVPNDQQAGGVWWESLGTITLTGDDLMVKVTNQVDKTYVIADAIRVVRIA